MTIVLTAMNRFLNEENGSQIAFLDGNQPDRLCNPLKDHIESRGGQVRINAAVEEIVTNEDSSIKHLRLRSGEILEVDEYVSAVPVDILKRMIPRSWSILPYFLQMRELQGIPVINLHLWFDRKLLHVDQLCFSRSPLLSVYADMSVTCKEYNDPDRSMLELVFAPCSQLAGASRNWMSQSDEDIIDATLKELERLFPTEVLANIIDFLISHVNDIDRCRWFEGEAAKVCGGSNPAVGVRSHSREKQISSVTALPYSKLHARRRLELAEVPWIHGRRRFRTVVNRIYESSVSIVLGGKLAAQVIAERSLGIPTSIPNKDIPDDIMDLAQRAVPKDPVGIVGSGAIAFGGGECRNK